MTPKPTVKRVVLPETGLAGHAKAVHAVLSQMEIGPNGPDEYCAATMLVLSSFVGPKRAERVAIIYFGTDLVEPISARLRHNGIWKGSRVHADWLEENGGIAFLADVLVGTGMFKRST